MSKNISISDDVYEALKRRKRGRSFSETIREAIESSGRISDVVGKQALPQGILADVKEEVERLSRGTRDRMNEAADEAS